MSTDNGFKYSNGIYHCFSDESEHSAKFTKKMEDWAEILKKAREAGLSYGEYVYKLHEEMETQTQEQPKNLNKGIYGIYENGALIKECVGYDEVAEFLNVSITSIRVMLKAGKYKNYQLKTLSKRKRNRPLYQLDGETKVLLARYDNPAEAARINDIDIKCIWNAVSKGGKSGGYYWIYCEDYDKKEG